MKKIFALFAFCGLLAGCNDTPDTPTPTSGMHIEDSQLTMTLSGDLASQKIMFSAYEAWTASVTDMEGNWCAIAPAGGNAGKITIDVQAGKNTTGAVRTATIVIKAGAATANISVTQSSQDVLAITRDNFSVPAKGGEILVEIKSTVDFQCAPRKSDDKWIEQIAHTGESTPGKLTTQTFSFRIHPYDGVDQRLGEIVVSTVKERKVINISQGSLYASTDFSKDGQVQTLQAADEGNGINIVLMGDAFTDRLINDGTYEATMRRAMEALFMEEPYTTYRHLFNIYAVSAVSVNEEYARGTSTVFSGFFGEGTHVGGRDIKCTEYAMKVPGMTEEKLNNTMIIVMMNRAFYAGTCYMYYPEATGPGEDYGAGKSIAYFPLGTDEDMFNQLLLHEAGGHGFPKLEDEYSYASQGRIPQGEIVKMREAFSYGWGRNVDLTDDPTAVKWSKFIDDSRYDGDGISVYEGGSTYIEGVFRSTFASIMVSNVGGFNAPSREAIYYRINKLAYGKTWNYDYETFVKYDRAAQAKAKANPRQTRSNMFDNLEPLHPPVIIRHN